MFDVSGQSTATGSYLKSLAENERKKAADTLTSGATARARAAQIPGSVPNGDSPPNPPSADGPGLGTTPPPQPNPLITAGASAAGNAAGQAIFGGGTTAAVAPTVSSSVPTPVVVSGQAVNPGWYGAAGYALPVVASALTAKAGYDVAKNKDPGNLGNVALGTNPMTAAPYWGMKALGIGMGRGKDADQRQRDQVRSLLKDNGVIDDSYSLTLADGTKFDIGADGGARQENGLRPFEVDFKNPLSKFAADAGGTLGLLISGGNKDIASSFGGYFANAAMSNAKSDADVYKNLASIMHSMKLDPNSAIAALKTDSSLSPQDLAIRTNGLNQVAAQYNTMYGTGGGGAAPSPGGGGFSFKMPGIKSPTPPPPVQPDLSGLMSRMTAAPVGMTDIGQLFNGAIQSMTAGRK